jgi:hypothetical protein
VSLLGQFVIFAEHCGDTLLSLHDLDVSSSARMGSDGNVG